MKTLLNELGMHNAELKGSKDGAKDKLKPRVSIAYRCEKCGRVFARSHPKDPQIYCERCRNDNVT